MTLKTMLRFALAASLGLFVASCQEDMQSSFGMKAQRPLKAETLALMESKGMRKEDPILVRAFKQESTLEIWKRDKTGRFAMLKSYQMCAWGGTLGPKIKEGDKQSPEGFYTVTPGRMNPNSQFYLAYDIGYPNAFDRAFGRTGAAVMVHGNCTGSAGCFVMTDAQVEEIYALARESLAGGQKSFQVQAFPFRMTAENLAKHRRSPHMAFWKNIKQGYDHFEVTKLEPKVDVCDKRYVFDARPKDAIATTFNPAGACPAYEVPSEIATAVAEKQNQDEQEFKVAVAQIEDADRKETERMVAERLEKSKPAQPVPGTAIASWFGAKPGEDVVAMQQPTPIDVPVPRASPMTATTRVAALSAPVEVPSSVVATATGLEAAPPKQSSGFTGLFGFGAAASEPADVAAVAIAAPSGQPIAVPIPAARPAPIRTASSTTVSTASVPSAAPVAAAPASAPTPIAPAAEAPLWKRLNPFGG